VSNSTTAGNYNAAVAVFNRSTHALICSTAASGAQKCPNVGSRWTDGSVSFAPGDDVTLTIAYDRAAGRDHFFVDDNTSGVSLSYGGYVPGTGKNYTRPGWAPNSPPPRGAALPTRLRPPRPPGDIPGQRPVTYSGGQSTFSSWWTHHKIVATSDGSSTGTVEVRPHNLFNFGANFGVYFQP